MAVNVKSLFKSKTFWFAVVQALLGIAIVSLTELDMVGYAAVLKSALDVVLRYKTSEPVKVR